LSITEDPSDRRLLEGLLLGRLSEEEERHVARRLAEDPSWQDLAGRLEPTDPLVEAVRGVADTPAPPDLPAVRDLLARLAPLATPTTIAHTTDAGAGPGETPPEAATCLRPPEGPDELGRLGGFRVLALLGRGGMGLVFRAEDPRLRRHVALKVIRPERAADASYRQRFLREARAAAALHHDHVVPIYQVGEDNGVPFLAMPLLAGETLEDRLRREGALPVGEVLRLGRGIAEGLAAAHAAGLVHRDVKPANVWLEIPSPPRPPSPTRGGGGEAVPPSPPGGEGSGVRGPRAKLLDFGLARTAEDDSAVSQAGAIVGTPAYMSPEQADGQPPDARSDLFSLGCVLYRMATGEPPFRGATLTATLRAVAECAPPPAHERNPAVPRALSDVIRRLLARDPASRPASARAAADALAALETGTAPTVSALVPARSSSRRWLLPAGVAAVLLAVGGVLVVGRGWLATRPEQPPAPPVPAPPAPVTYTGHATAAVWAKFGDEARRLELTDPGALPLRAGDQFRIEARVSPASYLYLFWIDTEGQVLPVYPWEPGKWGTRPAEESPRDELHLPPRDDRGYRITGERGGMETLLLLARPSPLDLDDAAVQALFAGVKEQRPVQDPRSAVWFENGRVVKDDVRRRSAFFEEADIDDPVLRMQELLRERLQPHASFTAAVSFAKRGK
jgi:serine/threonine protein kinase